MRKTLAVLSLLSVLTITPACETTAAVLATSAQEILSVYQLYVTDEAGNGYANATAVVGANVKYLALHGKVDGKLTLWGPNYEAGGAPMVLWEKAIRWDSASRALGIFFTAVDGESFVQVRSVPWDVARLSLTRLPPALPGSDAAEKSAPLESPKIPADAKSARTAP